MFTNVPVGCDYRHVEGNCSGGDSCYILYYCYSACLCRAMDCGGFLGGCCIQGRNFAKLSFYERVSFHFRLRLLADVPTRDAIGVAPVAEC